MVTRGRSISIEFNGHTTENEEKKKKESVVHLKEVLSMIRYEWPLCLREDANPIEMALSLLDDTSVGLAYKLPDFEKMTIETQNALRLVVNEHHEMFNNTVGSYHLLFSMIQSSKGDSNEIKEVLEEATNDIQTRSEALTELSQTSNRYSEMVEILDAMDELTTIPEKIDKLIIEKRIHEVYDVISNAYKLAEKHNLWSLSAMNATKDYLEIQSNNLFDMIVDELQNEIYLKNVSSVDENGSSQMSALWKAFQASSKPQLSSFKVILDELNTLEQFIYNSANSDISEIADFLCHALLMFLRNELPEIHANQSENSTSLKVDTLTGSSPRKNVESFRYIYMLLNTAAKLNRLTQVLEILENGQNQEFFSLINNVTDEVKTRNEQTLSKIKKLKNIDKSYSSDILGNSTFTDLSVLILKDFFANIFVRSLLVLQRHKAVSEIVLVLQTRDASQATYNFDTIWNNMTKRIRSLMYSYTYQNTDFSPMQGVLNNESNGRGLSYENVKKKSLFTFDDVLYDEASKMTTERILQDMFPGFSISNESNKNYGKDSFAVSSISTGSLYVKNESYNTMIKVLVPCTIYNMRIILEFFLLFISGAHILSDQKMHESRLTSEFSGSGFSFFTGYMKETFLPKLKECFFRSYSEIMTGHEEMSSDLNVNEISEKSRLFKLDTIPLNKVENENYFSFANNSSHSNALIYRNALDFKKLFINACFTLNTSLTFRSEYSVLCLQLLEMFAETYSTFHNQIFFSTVEDNQANSEAIGRGVLSLGLKDWLRTPGLFDASRRIISTSEESIELRDAIDRETLIMLYGRGENQNIFSIAKEGFLDDESLNQVCDLLVTTSWILSWLPSMIKRSQYVDSQDSDGFELSEIEKFKHEWSFLENGLPSASTLDKNHIHIRLALNIEMIKRFDDVVDTFKTINESALIALRYDLRCKGLYYIGLSFTNTDWILDAEPGDSDKYISLLNKEMFSFDIKLNTVLSSVEKRSIFVGLPSFFSEVMIQGSFILGSVNSNGIKKILLNILTLKQMLKNIADVTDPIDFSKASIYYEMFTLPEYEIIKKVSGVERIFNSGEMRNLVRLIYSEKLSDGGSSFHRTKYNELLARVSEVF